MFALFFTTAAAAAIHVVGSHGTCMKALDVCLQAEKQIRAKNANRYKQKMVRYYVPFFVCVLFGWKIG